MCKIETILENLKNEVTEATDKMTQEQAATFFGELADWAYAMSESLTLDNDIEMQNFEE